MTIYFGDGSSMAAAAGGNSTKLADANGTLTSGNDGDDYEIVVTGLGGYHQINFSLFVGHAQSNSNTGGNANATIQIGKSDGLITERYRWAENDQATSDVQQEKDYMYFTAAEGNHLGHHTGTNAKCSLVAMKMFNWNNTTDIVYGYGQHIRTSSTSQWCRHRNVAFHNPLTNHAMDRISFRFPNIAVGNNGTRYHYVIEGISS